MILYVGLSCSSSGVEALCWHQNAQVVRERVLELRPGSYITALNFFDDNFINYVRRWLMIIQFANEIEAMKIATDIHKQIEDYIIARLTGDTQ